MVRFGKEYGLYESEGYDIELYPNPYVQIGTVTVGISEQTETINGQDPADASISHMGLTEYNGIKNGQQLRIINKYGEEEMFFVIDVVEKTRLNQIYLKKWITNDKLKWVYGDVIYSQDCFVSRSNAGVESNRYLLIQASTVIAYVENTPDLNLTQINQNFIFGHGFKNIYTAISFDDVSIKGLVIITLDQTQFGEEYDLANNIATNPFASFINPPVALSIASFGSVDGDEITIDWDNTDQPNFESNRITYKTGSYPTNKGDGIVVDPAITPATITGLTTGVEYFFNVYSMTDNNEFSAPASISGTPEVITSYENPNPNNDLYQFESTIDDSFYVVSPDEILQMRKFSIGDVYINHYKSSFEPIATTTFTYSIDVVSSAYDLTEIDANHIQIGNLEEVGSGILTITSDYLTGESFDYGLSFNGLF